MRRSMLNPCAAACAVIAVVACSIGCAPPRKGEAPAPVAFEVQRRSATLEDCPESLAPCASITLEYFTITDGTDPVRAAIEAFLDTTVFAAVDESVPGSGESGAAALMQQFLDGYADFMRRYPDAPGTWSIRRSARPLWNEQGLFSIEFTETSYTGGAHPNASTVLVSLNARDGRRIALGDVLVASHEEPLRTRGERAFREAHGLTPGDDLVGAGFWFEDGGFRLNDNFAVTRDGLRFHYNAYEVAPYATGPTDLTLRRADLAGLVLPGGPLDQP